MTPSSTPHEPNELEPALEQRVRDSVAEFLPTAIARIEALPAQLGPRRFARVYLEGPPGSLIARVDAEEDPANRPEGVAAEPALEPIRTLLERRGLPVPRCHGHSASRGVDLLEDAGDVTLRDAAQASAPTGLQALYHTACDLVPRLQRIDPVPGVAAFERQLDGALFDYKAELFARWSLASRGRPATSAERRVIRDAFSFIAEVARVAPQRLAHRDFQSTNLHVHAGTNRLVMLDLQGAFLAPPEYDLVCLLRDSYVELEETQWRHQLERIRPSLPDTPAAETSDHRFDLLTLTRKGKDHARYLYAADQRGDSRFVSFVPAAVRALRGAAERSAIREPSLRPLAEIIHELPEGLPCAG